MDSELTLLQAAALAVIQGITEFVPISSSGHLVLARLWLGWSGDCGLAFDTVLHAGSLTALLIYFRRDLAAFCGGVRALISRNLDSAGAGAAEQCRQLWLLAVATLPAAIAGPALKPIVESDGIRNGFVTGACMIATALLFILADRRRPNSAGKMSLPDAFVVGCAQIVALLPGASRSGWTMGAGMLRGHERACAVRFSFLMAIPVIAGAIVFQARDIMRMPDAGIGPATMAVGFLVSFAASLGAIHFCARFFRTHRMRPFAIYLLVVGSLAMLSFLIRGTA